jgi:hypothetical protein
VTGKQTRPAFLGTLRSELDDSESGIHQDFEVLAGLVGAVRNAYLTHKLRPEPAAELFKMLRLASVDGREWTIGPTSGAWYERPLGSQTWTQATLPVGVEPSSEPRPDWLSEGVARQIAAETAAGAEQPRAETLTAEVGSSPMLNPFQRKEAAGDPVAPRVVADVPRLASDAGEDTDWLYEEWEGFDDQVNQLRTIRNSEPPVQDQLPSNLPAELQADHNLSQYLEEVSAPADRVGSDVEGGAPAPRAINPEDFFFRPEQ